MLMNHKESVLFALRSSQAIVRKMVEDLPSEQWSHQPCDGANSADWIVGHLALTDRRILKAFDVAELPTLPEGLEEKLAPTGKAAVAGGSYGEPKQLLNLFNAHRELLIAAVQHADEETFKKEMPSKSGLFKDLSEASLFMGIHTAMHVGQLTTIRRSLGYPPLF